MTTHEKNTAENAPAEKHLPEWVDLFEELKEEAEENYPDGRVRIIVPLRKKVSTRKSRGG